MKNIKNRILLTARELFNKLGYSNVTIRMIALELGISSGNLNYHFKKREDILEALYFEMVEVFDVRVDNVKDRELSFENIRSDIYSSMERMLAYKFFWTDLYNILRLNSALKNHFMIAYQRRIEGNNFLFDVLIKEQRMKAFETSKEKELLIDRMIGFSNTWLYNSYIYDKKVNPKYISKQCESLMLMFHPYLTELGKKQFISNS